MTVSSEESSVSYNTDAVTTSFPVPFYFLANVHLRVWLFDVNANTETDLVLGSAYQVSGAGDPAGGTVITSIAYRAGYRLNVERVVPITQETAYQRNDPFPASAHERALDKLTMICQRLAGYFGLLPGQPLRALLLGRNDVDGQGAYRARDNRIQDVGKPEAMNDAARKQDIVEALADLSTDGTGQFVVERLADSTNVTNGAGMVGFKQDWPAADAQTMLEQAQEFKSLRNFGDIFATNTAPAFINAFNYQAARTIAGMITSGGKNGVYTGSLPRLRLPAGHFKIDSTIQLPGYVLVEGDQTIIEMMDPAADIFAGTGYLWRFSGVQMVGGRDHIRFSNDNIDTTILSIDRCESQLANGTFLNTFATGGTFSHLSANVEVRNTRIIKPRQVMRNCCDSALFDNCWVFLSKTNFAPSTAAFVNRGDSSHPRLFLRNMFGVPEMGVPGVDRVDNARWIDNYGGDIIAEDCRFGGEDAGLSIVWQLADMPTTPYGTGARLSFRRSSLYAGPASRADSAVVVLDSGKLPQSVSIRDCTGPADVPFIANPSGFDIPAHLASWQAAALRFDYNVFSIDIAANASVNTDGSIYGLRMPQALRKFIVGSKQTTVTRSNLVLAALPSVNVVDFQSIEFDNAGAFTPATPTYLIMPRGCSRARITVYTEITANGTDKLLSVTLRDSTDQIVAGESGQRINTPDGDRMNFSVDVSGIPGSTYWRVFIRHTSTAALTMAKCRVTITPLDHVS